MSAGGGAAVRRVRGVAGAVLFWGAVAAALWFVWPSSLGGCTTTAIVSGRSMEPTYRTGDVVVARCGTPHLGDVVVYAPAGQGGRVVHRLVGGDGTAGWEVRGDGNAWSDPTSPTDAQVVGVVVMHVPRVGALASVLLRPAGVVALVAVGVALLVWPRRRDDEPSDDAPSDDAPSAAPPVAVSRAA